MLDMPYFYMSLVRSCKLGWLPACRVLSHKQILVVQSWMEVIWAVWLFDGDNFCYHEYVPPLAQTFSRLMQGSQHRQRLTLRMCKNTNSEKRTKQKTMLVEIPLPLLSWTQVTATTAQIAHCPHREDAFSVPPPYRGRPTGVASDLVNSTFIVDFPRVVPPIALSLWSFHPLT